ncbi:mechanosensitive ion channel family protein [Leucobacter sp. M11]|uniref:mechanosensitive ion channel family protein n=1 Tax=Leucobacter sp. M11 TaxID=2993565 RepID=UPI002D800900|nr:mechanosensitive ion channel family protein [Leucobacter sp. M11]MEB4616241.1 mechanosensitive ion channel family protein [Leucobacter sp. M11]
MFGLDQQWMIWAIIFAVGLPVTIVVLTEVIGSLQRRGSAAVKPVRLLRNWVVPVAAVLALLAFAVQQPTNHVWVRVVATLLGFLVILLLLSSFNVALFANAEAGTWRDRIPSIFIDLTRLVLIVVGLAVLFSWVWGADVGGLFAALGVTSIVVGLALQNAVGGIVSGLLLLFEQPFEIGDWLDTGTVRGRVVEVNWRAVHIDSGAGIQIVPNAALAGASFRNLSRPDGPYRVPVELTFSTDDAPDSVIDTLIEVAAGLGLAGVPGDRAGVSAVYLGAASYRVSLPLAAPSEESAAVNLFRQRLWYETRRAGLALDGDATDPVATVARREEAIAQLAALYRFDEADREALLNAGRIVRYGSGETVFRPGTVPDEVGFVVSGRVGFWGEAFGPERTVSIAEVGEIIGQTALTRERTRLGSTARGIVLLLSVPVAALDPIVRSHPDLARRIGDSIELRRSQLDTVLAEPPGPLASPAGPVPSSHRRRRR